MNLIMGPMRFYGSRYKRLAGIIKSEGVLSDLIREIRYNS